MKRRKTDFEKSLTEKGWSLSFKSYFGKNQDKVKSYTYIKWFDCTINEKIVYVIAEVDLEPKRDSFTNVRISNKMPDFIDNITLIIYKELLLKVETEVRDCLLSVNKWEENTTPEETIAVVECLENQNE